MSEPATRLDELTLCAVGIIAAVSPLAVHLVGFMAVASPLPTQALGVSAPPVVSAGVGELIGRLYAVVVRPALIVFGVAFAATGGATLRGDTLSARSSALTPALAAGLVTTSFGAAVLSSLTTPAIPPTVQTAAATAAVGSAVMPLVLASLQGDAPVLIAATALLLGASAVAPSSFVSLVVGLTCGVGSVTALWILDANTWRP